MAWLRLFAFFVFSLFCFLPRVQAGGVSAGLLTSGCWCSFKYSQVTGYSNTKKYCFNGNGTCSMGGRGEGYSSGGGGTFASQQDSGGSCRWKVTGGELYMADPGEDLAMVQTLVKTNSNGSPIIVADGVEYAQCR